MAVVSFVSCVSNVCVSLLTNTFCALKPEQNGRHFTYNIFIFITFVGKSQGSVQVCVQPMRDVVTL